MLITAPETITLQGGFVVTLDALRLVWDLEERGFHVRLAEDGGLLVGPRSRLTPADDRAIRQHRNDLLALVRYVDEAIQ